MANFAPKNDNIPFEKHFFQKLPAKNFLTPKYKYEIIFSVKENHKLYQLATFWSPNLITLAQFG